MKNKGAYIIDYIFVRLILGVLIFSWCKFYIDSLIIASLYSAIILALVWLAIDMWARPRRKKMLQKMQNKKEAQEIFLQFLYNTQEYVLDNFYNAIAKKYNVSKTERALKINKEDKELLLYPCFIAQKLSQNDFASIVADSRKHQVNRLIILCPYGFVSSVNIQAKQIKDYTIYLLGEQESYELIKKFGILPQKNITLKKDKKTWLHNFATIFFCRARVKGYLISSIILLLSSYFMPFALYYIIMASVLLIFSILCFFLPNVKKEKNKNII